MDMTTPPTIMKTTNREEHSRMICSNCNAEARPTRISDGEGRPYCSVDCYNAQHNAELYAARKCIQDTPDYDELLRTETNT